MASRQELIDECVGNAHGNLARVREILDAEPSLVDARASWDESPLEAATQMGNRELIEFLLGRGARPQFLTSCVLGDEARVRAALADEPGLALRPGVHGLAPLYFAAIGSSLPVAELLHQAGALADQRCEAAAPIHGAVMGRSPELARWLLEHGADPSAPDYKGRSAGQLAAEMGEPELAELFK